MQAPRVAFRGRGCPVATRPPARSCRVRAVTQVHEHAPATIRATRRDRRSLASGRLDARRLLRPQPRPAARLPAMQPARAASVP